MESIEVKDLTDWTLISINDRVDSFNHDDMTDRVNEIIRSGRKQLAVDLERANFLSLPAIKFLTQVAEELKNDGGEMALLAPSEKIKRQIDIFASLKPMRLFRNKSDFKPLKFK